MKSLQPLRFETGTPKLLAGLRQTHAFAAAAVGVAQQWEEFQRTVAHLPQRVGDLSYGVLCGAGATGFEYLCGMEVSSFESIPASLGRMRIPAQDYAVFRHSGGLAAVGATWNDIFHGWLRHHGYESAHKPDFERYPGGFHPVVDAGEIELWVAVVKSAAPRASSAP